MNRIIYFLSLLLLLVSSCAPQKRLTATGKPNQNTYSLNLPAIDAGTEQFNFKLFDSNYVHQPPDTAKQTGLIGPGMGSYEAYDSSGRIRIQYSQGLGGNGDITGYDFSINPLIGIYKEFDKNGNIKMKGLYCWFNFKIGTWYYYNKDGKLTDTKNFDDGYNCGYAEVFDFCIRNDISLERKAYGYRTTITKYRSPQNKLYWNIQYPSTQKPVYTVIQLNGKTGEVVSTRDIPLPADIDAVAGVLTGDSPSPLPVLSPATPLYCR